MYDLTGKERVIPISPALPLADAGAPSPRLVANEFEAAVAYWTAGNAHRVAVVRFSESTVYFGPPNDEALDGHPLYAAGLEHYAFAEVLESPWIATLEQRNRVHPDHNPTRFSHLRHFVLTSTTASSNASPAQSTPRCSLPATPKMLYEISSFDKHAVRRHPGNRETFLNTGACQRRLLVSLHLRQ